MRVGPSDMRATAVFATVAGEMGPRPGADLRGALPSHGGGGAAASAASRLETEAELERFEARKAESAAFGYLRGIGVCLRSATAVSSRDARESAGGGYLAEAEVCPISGRVRLVAHMESADFGGLMVPASPDADFGVPLRVVHDDSGLLLTASLMDTDRVGIEDDIRPRDPLEADFAVDDMLDVGGYGRLGTMAMRRAVANAVLDALWARGVRRVTMPLTPEKVRGWLNGRVEGAPI